MNVLLSNDDGVLAPGIRSLYQELSPHHQTTIIAPLEERSTTGHSLSLDRPLRLERLENNIYGCTGFPGDCVLTGLGHLLKGDKRPDVVVSGINRGANLGQDLYYSGTVAAAREAAFHGVAAISVSLVLTDLLDVHRYHVGAKFVRLALEAGMHKLCAPLTLININVPNLEWEDIKGCKLTEIGFRQYSEEIHARMDTRGREYYWIAGKYQGHLDNSYSDCSAVDDGYIAVTPHVLIPGHESRTKELEGLIEKLNAEF